MTCCTVVSKLGPGDQQGPMRALSEDASSIIKSDLLTWDGLRHKMLFKCDMKIDVKVD